MYEYENTRRVAYGGDDDSDGSMVFVPVCKVCGRYVKADETVKWNEAHGPAEPNATCKKCGRVGMPFEGFL